MALGKPLNSDDTIKLSNNEFYRFMRRSSNLKLAEPQKVSTARAKLTSRKRIKFKKC